ncbi:FAD-binding domain-containing protein [Mytilinidion resinicola]|uniref:FAD-binding domain-containing protein n=1 Tax=Mytilinidion resinicola TaxID=574789 RepID=A0A6A6YH43_9PEZI|nr:FAD-binding domain-containing protein [Mytilinidion resinicola]KAF2807335.1 FAD-binding domain-containing protein [Mytilinidion resinicola]
MEQAIQFFRLQQIPVLEPGQAEYRQAIATSNLLFRFSRPDCVVQPKNAAQVQTIIREAKAGSIKVTIKCNGHSYAGHSTAFSGISLDLRGMKKAELDMKAMTVTMDAGCQWGDVYEKLIIGNHDGFIINGGRCPTVGVSGFILGAGLGPFTRSFGMGADTLAEATLVTANGSLITVTESDPPTSDKGRLFWALRGAGGGNFGVVVQMKLHVQKLSNRHGMVVAGRYQWFPKSGFTDAVMATMNAFYATPWPDKLTIDTTWICDLRQASNEGGVRFNVSFDGSKGEYDRLITKHITHPELQTQLKRRVLPEKSTRFLYETLVAQWLEEAERAYPSNKTYELYSSFIFTNSSPAALATITTAIRELMKTFRDDFKGEQVNFLVTWIHSGGKASERQPTDTAFFWREAVFHTYVTVEWADKWMERDMRRFLASVKKKLRPLSLNGEASFVNFPDRDFPTKFHERAYFGGNKDELRRVKQMWDPDGFFRWIQGVRRPGDPEEDEVGEDEDRTDKLASEQWGSQWKHYQVEDLEDDFNDLADLGYGEDD